MRFVFHPRADEEFEDAVRYYEECQPGLGLDFAEEAYGAIRRAAEYPEAWTVLSRNTRRCLLNRFPYGIIFQVKCGMLFVIAVSNLHRRPAHWRGRISKRS